MARLPGVESSDQIVCHVDMDCFYAACERLREPKLEDEPVVVGMGYESDDPHGAVATASYEAREYGVESAMAISDALERLPRHEDTGPDKAAGFYRPVDIEFYESISETVREVLSTEADTVRNVSIDEAYLALDDIEWDEAESFGRSLKQKIESSAGVVASVGIAPDMTTAKLASDADKPDGLVVVEPASVRTFLAPIPIRELHGVGPVTATELRKLGFETAEDIATAEQSVFVDAFGERGRDLYAQARGEDDRNVEPKGRPKSVSSESAFAETADNPDRKEEKVQELAVEATTRATEKNALYQTVGIKVVIPPFDVNTRSRSFSGPVDDPELVQATAVEMLAEFETDTVRKLGVKLSNLSFDDRKQATITDWESLDGSNSENRGWNRDRPIVRQVELSRFE